MSSINTEHFAELSILVSGQKAEARDFGGASLFKEAELKQVNKLAALYKEARAIVAEKSKRAEMCKRAENLSGELTKQAFISNMPPTIGKTISNISQKAGSGVANAGIGAAKAVGKAGVAIGAGLYAGGKAVNRVLAAPGKIHPGLDLSVSPLAVAGDALTHSANGGAGFTRNGAPKDVWDALQH